MLQRVASNVWRSTRALWYTLAGLMILSPLGLLAAGTAWGEWGVEDFANAQTREQMLHASANVAPPSAAPQGLERMSRIWAAPMPDYAPRFMHNASFGYILSAVFGAGLILLVFLLLAKFSLKKSPTNTEAG
jgi:cobalt/nickel transport system permease protein